MKKLLLIAPTLLFLTHCGKPSANDTAGSSESSVPSPYAETLAVLDEGGVNYQLVDGAYEWASLKPMLNFFSSMVFMGIKESSPESLTPQATERLKTLPQRMGLDEVLVRGSSTVERAEGGYLSKVVIQKQPDAEGWIWDFAGKPMEMATRIRQMPATTVLLSHYAVNAPLLYEEIKKELSPFPRAAMAVNQGETMLRVTGVPLDALLKSMEQGISLALTMDEGNSWILPIPNVTFQIPETGAVMILPDENSEILNFLLKQIKEKIPMPLINVDVEGVAVNALPIPVPVSTAVSLQMANLDGSTYIATSQDLMQQLIQRRDGSVPSAFSATLEGLENTRASVALIGDPKLTSVIDHSVGQMIGMMDDEDAEEIMGPMVDYYKSLFFSLPQVALNRAEGDLNVSVMLHQNPLAAQYSSNNAMTVPMVGGLLAAIALPSFQKARATAQQKSCTNNLRMLGAAKDQWAIEEGLAVGYAADENKIAAYLKNGIPVCPQGGTYTLNPIDTPPACSVHGSQTW